MPSITLRAHFDGEKVVLDEAYSFEPDDTLLVTVLSNRDKERESWRLLSSKGLSGAYSDDEPDYSVSNLIEANPEYDRG